MLVTHYCNFRWSIPKNNTSIDKTKAQCPSLMSTAQLKEKPMSKTSNTTSTNNTAAAQDNGVEIIKSTMQRIGQLAVAR